MRRLWKVRMVGRLRIKAGAGVKSGSQGAFCSFVYFFDGNIDEIQTGKHLLVICLCVGGEIQEEGGCGVTAGCSGDEAPLGAVTPPPAAAGVTWAQG